MENENLEKSNNINNMNIVDIIELKDLHSFIDDNQNENCIENVFDSIQIEDFVIVKKEKFYLRNNKDLFKEISDENFNHNIVSISYNKNMLLYVKNNGECFITDGNGKSTDLKLNFFDNLLCDFNNFTLKNSLKLSGNLNKKYLIKVLCGESHVIFLTHAGMVFSMGKGNFGQLGVNNLNDSNDPQMLTSLLNYRVKDIAVGSNHNLVLATMRDLTKKSSNNISNNEIKIKEQNFILVWGDNSKGQLGIKNLENTSQPTILEYFYINKLNIQKIQTGINHSLVLLENGKCFSFGSNEYNQIDDKEEKINFIEPFRIKINLQNDDNINDFEIRKNKNKIINIKCSANSSLLITDQNYIIIKGKINQNNIPTNKITTRIFKIKGESNKIDNILNEILTSEINLNINHDNKLILIFTDEKLQIINENLTIPIKLTEIKNTPNQNSSQFKLKENFKLKEISENPPQNIQIDYTPNDTYFYNDFDISKEFLSDIASTQDIYDNNISFEQSIEELRSYISLVGISFAGDSGNQPMSFRPKNLPKKTKEEEEYHRKLVEENRRMYLRLIKDKQEEDRKIKEKNNFKKEKLKKLQEFWENEILPNWFRKKKDYNYLKKYFYEGIPTNLRGKIWSLCIGNNFSITTEYYEIEVKKAVNILNQLQITENEENNLINNNLITPNTPTSKYNINIIGEEKSIKYIDLDIDRTFPHLGIFRGNSPLADDLREILQAFVVSRPDIGYVQGMSFIAGMLLLHMHKFQSFVALINITLSHNIIPFYRFDEHQIRKRLQIFKQIFYNNLPELCDLFENQDILPEHYLIEWNMTLFSKNLNIDIAARIWDIYMIDGIKAIYQTAIVILSHFEKKFLESDYEFIMITLKNTNNLNFDEDKFVEMMKQVKFPEWINNEIQKLNDEYVPIF